MSCGAEQPFGSRDPWNSFVTAALLGGECISLSCCCHILFYYITSSLMSQMGLPEQVNSEAKGKGSGNTQKLHRADAFSTQRPLIHHTDLCGAFSLLPTETAEPQAKCSQITATAFGVDTNTTAGLHSPRCFSSSVPAQRLAPPTNLTDSEQKRNLLLKRLKWNC